MVWSVLLSPHSRLRRQYGVIDVATAPRLILLAIRCLHVEFRLTRNCAAVVIIGFPIPDFGFPIPGSRFLPPYVALTAGVNLWCSRCCCFRDSRNRSRIYSRNGSRFRWRLLVLR